MDKKRVETVTTSLGLVLLGAGSSFVLLPRLVGRGFGLTTEASQQGGAHVVIRALGTRDIALGLGLLANRKSGGAGRLWLQLFSLCMAGDVAACVLALPRPNRNLLSVVGGGLASTVFGLLAWNAAGGKKR